ncbi:MAG: hypothetical protein U0838_13670 [Chloroflexota bacterium]
MDATVIAFAVFGILGQLWLVAFFAARRWAPGRADRPGRIAYGFALAGVPLAAWLVLVGATTRLIGGPLLFAAWAALGIAVDLWRPRPWRAPPIDWPVMAPYVALFFFAQMFLWWPLWDLARPAWLGFGLLFVANTALNLQGHAAANRGTAPRG